MTESSFIKKKIFKRQLGGFSERKEMKVTKTKGFFPPILEHRYKSKAKTKPKQTNKRPRHRPVEIQTR